MKIQFFLLEAAVLCLALVLMFGSCKEKQEKFIPVEHAPITPADTVKQIDTPKLAVYEVR